VGKRCRALEGLEVNESEAAPKVLVTGNHGYIGTLVGDLLNRAGFAVAGLDVDFFCSGSPSADCKDIRDILPGDLEGVEAVVHLAALSNDPMGELNPHWTDEINYLASVRLAQTAKQVGVRRFLFASSCSIYGNSGSEQWVNEDSPLAPLTGYAISKVKTEEALANLADVSFCPVILRNATAYGFSPNLRVDLVLNNLTGWAFTTGKIMILSDGTSWRPIVHVQDIAQAFLTLLRAPAERVRGQAFNVGINKENYQVKELASVVQAATGCAIEYSPTGGPDLRSYRVDFTKLSCSVPEYQPRWDAEAGVLELLRAFQENHLTLEDFQGRKYIRIKQLQYLLEHDLLDDDLRWKVKHKDLGND
jgi:nucleoside-diphosphate-sugar epimerase